MRSPVAESGFSTCRSRGDIITLMNDLPVIGSSVMRKEFWDRRRQTLQVA